MRITLSFLFLLLSLAVSAQRADSAVVADLRSRGVTFSSDNSIILLPSGREKFADMFAAISRARHSLHLEYFNFRNDSIAGALFRLLGRKVREGVEVRVLFDAFGNASNNQPLLRRHLDSIRAHGIEVYMFDPLRFPWVNHVFSRDHRKIVVIDGRVAYTGGMNVADYYIKGTPQVGSWQDMHCRIVGQEVNTLQGIFLRIWNRVSRQQVSGSRYYRGTYTDTSYLLDTLPRDTDASAGQKMVGVINREPRTSPAIIRDFYLSAIRHARDSIRIINPYFTLTHALKRELRRAIRRGVKVEIMLSTHSDIPITPDCGYYNAHRLMRHGATVWMYTPGFHHTKTITVDGQLCTVGSANLNARSLRFDYEENLVVIDPCLTRQLDRRFDADKQKSFLLTPASWREWRTPWQRFRGWASHLLAPLL